MCTWDSLYITGPVILPCKNSSQTAVHCLLKALCHWSATVTNKQSFWFMSLVPVWALMAVWRASVILGLNVWQVLQSEIEAHRMRSGVWGKSDLTSHLSLWYCNRVLINVLRTLSYSVKCYKYIQATFFSLFAAHL